MSALRQLAPKAHAANIKQTKPAFKIVTRILLVIAILSSRILFFSLLEQFTIVE